MGPILKGIKTAKNSVSKPKESYAKRISTSDVDVDIILETLSIKTGYASILLLLLERIQLMENDPNFSVGK
jgi:hypothetical protein